MCYEDHLEGFFFSYKLCQIVRAVVFYLMFTYSEEERFYKLFTIILEIRLDSVNKHFLDISVCFILMILLILHHRSPSKAVRSLMIVFVNISFKVKEYYIIRMRLSYLFFVDLISYLMFYSINFEIHVFIVVVGFYS